jgi:hypothetical protein
MENVYYKNLAFSQYCMNIVSCRIVIAIVSLCNIIHYEVEINPRLIQLIYLYQSEYSSLPLIRPPLLQ